MKKLFFIIYTLASMCVLMAQNDNYSYHRKNIPRINVDKIKSSNRLIDICPEMWQFLGFPRQIEQQLQKIKKEQFPLSYYTYPPSGYDMILNIISIEISTKQNNKLLSAKSDGDFLSNDQKKLLLDLAIGTEVDFNIVFQFKDSFKEYKPDEYQHGLIYMTLVPNKEASFPGSNKSFNTYLSNQLFNKIVNSTDLARISQVKLNFTIDNNGQVVKTKITSSSGKPNLDKLILDAFNKMPKWQAAQNIAGVKIEQTFSFAFREEGC